MGKLKFERRVGLNFGDAIYNQSDLVLVGDRYVPQHISVNFPGGDDQPSLYMSIDVVDGVPMCTELKLTKKDDGREVRSKDVRLIRLEDWLEYIVAACSHPYADDGRTVTIYDHPAAGPTPLDRRKVSEVRKPVRNANRGRRTIDREFLEKVADIYREHFDDRPTEAVGRSFGVKPRTAAWYVELCRSDEHQLLPKAEKGKKTK